MTHHTAHGKLDNVETNEESINVFRKCLDDRDVPSLCQISGVRISGRQFFPCEGIRQAKELFDVGFTITVMRTKLQLVNESVLDNDILRDTSLLFYFDLLNYTVTILKCGNN
jgi:hypothetical protein